MKIQICIWLVFINCFTLFGQEIRDTVKIREVELQAEKELDEIHQLDYNQIERSVDNDLGELLDKQSHLFVKSYGIGSLASISLRGSGSAHTKLLWNDIAINSALNGTSDLSLFALEFIDEVQLDYGLRSLRYGSGGIGGAIQLNNKVNFKQQKSMRLLSQLGSFGRKSYSAKLTLGNNKLQSITKALFKKADNDFEYKDLTVEGFPDRRVSNASLEQSGIIQSLHYRLKENQFLEGHLWWFQSERNLPPLITLRDNVEFQEDESIRALVGYRIYFDKGELKVKSSYLKESLRYFNDRANINTTTNMLSSRSLMEYSNKWKKIAFTNRINIDIDNAQSPSYQNKVKQQRFSVFTSLKYQLHKKLETEIALREEWIVGKSDFLMPSLAINYQLKEDQWELFALLGRNIKYPTLNDLYWLPFGNEDLKAEKGNSIEIGSNYSTTVVEQFQFISSLAFFSADIKDYIQWKPTAFGYWRPQNLNEVSTKGIETSIELQQNKAKLKKHFKGNYSYTQSLNKESIHPFDESVDKQLVYIPEHKYNLQLNLFYGSVEFLSNYQFIGQRFLSSDNKDFLPSYSITDISVRMRFQVNQKNELLLQLSALNIFDTEYQAIEWRPMPNRNYLIKLQYQISE